MKDLKQHEVPFTADPYWPHRYDAERERIQSASDDRPLGVFHVGSTAIPDVPGKPALDIVAVYDEEESMVRAIKRLTDDDRYEQEAESTLVVRWAEEYAVFIKMHTKDDQKVRNQLLFRDYLRENSKARAEYARIKREAAKKHPEDLEAYTDAKSEVVRSILEQAREEGYDRLLPGFA